MFVLSRGHKAACTSLTLLRNYKVLAIESSCDDACVALLDRFSLSEPPKVIYEEKVTLDSKLKGGVVPVDAARHNNENVALVTQKALKKVGWGDVTSPESIPDLVCATRGPGMTGSLSAGYMIAQGLSVAWNRPLVGVHHMLGHLLVPRLSTNGERPQFPFLSLLVSGGHTICLLSRGIVDHEILIDTIDIAAGDALDKCGRLLGIRGNMIGKEMEVFLNEHKNQWGKEVDFNVVEPLQNQVGRKDMLAFSFASFESQVKSSLARSCNGELPEDNATRSRIMYKVQNTIFKHIITKIKLAYKLNPEKFEGVTEFVCSGGVGSSMHLRSMLSEELGEKSIGIKNFYYPEVRLCTDNATMIGWAGIELYEKKKLTTELGTSVIRKWPIDEIMKLEGWVQN